MQVDYKFELDQRVTTPFGDMGIVAMLGFDEVGCQYFVKTRGGFKWYKEKELGPYPAETGVDAC